MKNTLMKTLSNPCRKPAAVRRAGGYLFLLAGLLAMRVTQAAGLAATNTPAAIPWNQIGTKAGAHYQGDGRPGAVGELFRRRKDEQFFRRSKVVRAKLRCVDFLPDAARQMRARASCQDRIDFPLR